MSRAASVVLLVAACGTATGGGSTDDGGSTTTTTMTGGATWQDVPTTGEGSTSSTSVLTASDSGELETTTTDASSSSSGQATVTEATTGASSSSESSSSESGPPLECDAMTCGECAECALEIGACAQIFSDCQNMPGCVGAVQCFTACGVEGLCLDNCCEQLNGQAIETAMGVNECIARTCAVACDGYTVGNCD